MLRTKIRYLFLLVLFSGLFFGCKSPSDSQNNNNNNTGDTNTAPSAVVSSSNTTVDVGTEVTLDGSGSTDDDGDDLSYSWELSVPSSSQASLSATDVAKPAFTPDVEGDYTATLTVSDGTDNDSNDITIKANAVEPKCTTTEISGTISEDRTLKNSCDDLATADYVVTGTVEVNGGAQLTVEPGVRIEFDSGTDLKVVNNSSIVAVGTKDSAIVFTGKVDQAGYWNGLGIYSGNTLNELSYVEVAYGGGDNLIYLEESANIALWADARLKLTHSRIHDSKAYGLHAHDGVNLDGFSSNTFENNGKAPVSVSGWGAGYIDGASTFSNNTKNYVRVFSGDPISSDMTLSKLSGGVTYHFGGEFKVNDGVFTVEPGTEIDFESGSRFKIVDGSSIHAVGNKSEPIIFTGVQKQAGAWVGIGIYSGNTANEMSYVEVSYAGSDNLIYIDADANIALDGGARLKLTHSTIKGSSKYGLHADDNASLEGFSSNTFENNTKAPVSVSEIEAGYIDGNSTFTNNDDNFVRVYSGDNIMEDMTISKLADGVPYHFDGEFKVRKDAVLTIEAGTEIDFNTDSDLTIGDNGAIVAVGTETDPITFTGVQQNPGSWYGIGIYSSNTLNEISYADISYGGSDTIIYLDGKANVALDGGSRLKLTNSTIHGSGGYAVWYDNNDVILDESGNTFSNNISGDIGTN